jgi:sigma-B regulation protein RsbU (phosphoserine phosphatase)
MYITAFYAIFNLKDRSLTYANAGHNASPVLITAAGTKVLDQPGLPLCNWLEHPEYRDEQLDYKPGDRLLIFTDGLVEIRKDNLENFGTDRLLEHVLESSKAENAANTAKNVAKMLEAAVKKACSFGGINNITKIPDDITVALFELH